MSQLSDKSDSVPFVDYNVSSSVNAQRVFNYVLGSVILLMVILPIGFIALLIKLDSPGPVFFRQPRIGLHNRIFFIWKFRTMYESYTDVNGTLLTKRNDPRVTRIGARLRRRSIDELPQILNVLIGEMALVGPRPHAREAKVGERLYADVVPGYHRRHAVLPGITGWAQVNGWRGETINAQQIEERVRYDLDYIKRRSIWFDIKILLMTMARLRHGAF